MRLVSLLASFAFLELALAILGVTVRTKEKTLVNLAIGLEREVAVPPGPKLCRSAGASRPHCEQTTIVVDITS